MNKSLAASLWYDMPHRTMWDADLLGFGSSDLGSIAQTFRGIASIEVEDGIAFDPVVAADTYVIRTYPPLKAARPHHRHLPE